VQQTIDQAKDEVEREDLSADELLKLHDQSFTRYLNVHDDYRSRPVTVASKFVKQDLIDNDILESVPKTMKAKAQLLLKKMNDWSCSLRSSSADRSSLSSMVCIFFSKVSMTLTRCSTGGFGRS
jgi:hypothetical protein